MTVDTHFLEWTHREEHAERMVPLIGTLYREHSVIVTIYGKPLTKKSAVDIIKAHKYAQKFDGEQAVNMAESEAVLQRLVELNLAPSKIDVGKIVSQAREANTDLIEFVDATLAPAANRPGTILNEPRDIVLYGFCMRTVFDRKSIPIMKLHG